MDALETVCGVAPWPSAASPDEAGCLEALANWEASVFSEQSWHGLARNATKLRSLLYVW
jgi:hypothetical protein